MADETDIDFLGRTERIFGLIGYPLQHSFSREYFARKFRNEGIDNARYLIFELRHVTEWSYLPDQYPNLEGLNVTLPYKKKIIPFLSELSREASQSGSVNCIFFEGKKAIGHNTDIAGFEKSLQPLLRSVHTSALILGNGGSSASVQYVLNKWKIPFTVVCRQPQNAHEISFHELDAGHVKQHKLIVQTTPVGMAPDIGKSVPFPFDGLGADHLLYDLIYNPIETLFLSAGKKQGAQVKNGQEMLEIQAEASWQIWNGNQFGL